MFGKDSTRRAHAESGISNPRVPLRGEGNIQTAPRLSIHGREMQHRQNLTYFGGPRLQAVGITSNEKSHCLGWGGKSFLSQIKAAEEKY